MSACQGHPAAVVTSTTPLPPVTPKVCDVGEMVKVQPDDCVTAIVRSATVIVPLRCTLMFAATENAEVPLPVPDAPLVSVIQDTWLLDVHAQPVPLVTVTDADPLLAPRFSVVGDTVNVQPVDCVTEIFWSATVNVPVRAAPVFAVT